MGRKASRTSSIKRFGRGDDESPGSVTAPSIVRTMRTSATSPATGLKAAGLLSATAIGSGTIAPRPPHRHGATLHGSNAEMSQRPSTLFKPTLTLLAANAPSGFSLLVVIWLMNTRTTAESGCISDTAARTTDAVVLTASPWRPE